MRVNVDVPTRVSETGLGGAQRASCQMNETRGLRRCVCVDAKCLLRSSIRRVVGVAPYLLVRPVRVRGKSRYAERRPPPAGCRQRPRQRGVSLMLPDEEAVFFVLPCFFCSPVVSYDAAECQKMERGGGTKRTIPLGMRGGRVWFRERSSGRFCCVFLCCCRRSVLDPGHSPTRPFLLQKRRRARAGLCVCVCACLFFTAAAGGWGTEKKES